jgi:DNA-binding NtrC family response regulator
MKILIADDEESLRDLLVAVLTRRGHEVVACKNGLEAYQQFMKANREGSGFDAVISDYQMPEKNGVVLFMEIRKVNPAQKCILVSGDPPTLPEYIRKETGEFPILRKPYRSDDLIALL